MAREYGHGARVFNMAWDPLGAALATRPEFCHQMNNMLWYYELFRTPDGAFEAQMDGVCTYPAGTTGVIGLALTLPGRILRVTGASRGVFGRPPPPGLEEAARMFRKKDWTRFEAALRTYLAKPNAPNRAYAEALLGKYRAQQAHASAVLGLAKRDIAAGDGHLANARLRGLATLLGKETPEIRALRTQAKDAPRRRRTAVTRLDKRIKPHSALFPPTQEKHEWESLLPPAQETARSRRDAFHVYIADEQKTPELGDWSAPTYEARGWKSARGPVRLERGQQMWLRRTFKTLSAATMYKYFRVKGTASGEVYLNGYRIGILRRGAVRLRPDLASAFAKKGASNVLAMHVRGNWHPSRGVKADVSLEAGPPRMPDLDSVLDGQ
jgi:hypothetical protein